jgi:hypothetical protein
MAHDLVTRDSCGEFPLVHITEIRNGKTSERHLCLSHARDAGVLAADEPQRSAEEAVVRGMLPTLRGTAEFIRRNGRSPSSLEELGQAMSLPSDSPAVDISDAKLIKVLHKLDELVGFAEKHGRFPQSDAK